MFLLLRSASEGRGRRKKRQQNKGNGVFSHFEGFEKQQQDIDADRGSAMKIKNVFFKTSLQKSKQFLPLQPGSEGTGIMKS
ncbi:hypothetical protein [Pedobacter sp. SYP-B3415]|uniref:hypothetical protein n=1 Tax=Pedobacter sp. SYP-B3415 TaxID=2496641 RepID=UPI00101C3093|nr:hypothetical protein [Pedobacter sp. SYP-B3415]